MQGFSLTWGLWDRMLDEQPMFTQKALATVVIPIDETKEGRWSLCHWLHLQEMGHMEVHYNPPYSTGK